MKTKDAVKKMNEIKNIVEKTYPGVKADIAINDWEKSGYHRLYINLVITGRVNGKTVRESTDFGFINLKTSRYNQNGAYDMRHFDAGKFTPAKMLYDYAEAYKTADNDKTLYVAKEGFRITLGLSKEEEEKGISRREMLDKSIEMNISPENFDAYWDALNCAQSAQATEKKDGHAEKKKRNRNRAL